MSVGNNDIPEVFRRAMKGWEEEEEGNGRSSPPSFPPSPRPFRAVGILGLILLLLLSLNGLVIAYTDWLWFKELNYQAVWLKQWGARLLTFGLFFVVGTAVLLINWQIARRRAIRHAIPRFSQFLQSQGTNWLTNGTALLSGIILASAGGSQWELFLRYFYRVPFGTPDPIFGRDISFYFFELPVYSFLQGWLLVLLALTLAGVVLIYALNSLPDIQRRRWQPQQTPGLRPHAAWLGALFLLVWAIGYRLNLYELLYSTRGVVVGASYTDLNASYYALWTQLGLMILVAIAVFYNIFRLNIRLVVLTGGLWVTATIVLGSIYPIVLQRYVVEPNEIERERPYIEHNIAFTRLAFGLDAIETRPFTTITDLDQQDLAENEIALQNIRLWDYRPLHATYQQLQTFKLYYQFGEIDIDRYAIDGQTRQVMLAARELNKTNLPAQSWVSQNLEFTHGYGIVMNPVDRVTPDGQPEFFIQDLPPRTNIPLELTRPEIYYGELTQDVIFAGSREEFSYPSGNENVYSIYAGSGGVPLDSSLKRLAFAWRLGDLNILLNDEIDTDTKVLFYRQIQQRIRQITPFLALDKDPYIVVWNGRLVWIQDAYTLSSQFPYATATANGYNYIRNAVKITIDAYDGTVNYYTATPEDPIIQTYARAFPGLFHSLSEMPSGLQAHIRYPEDLFTVQTQQYLTYHMTDVRVFYNKEDMWQVPNEVIESGEQLPMEAYYVTLPLPDEPTPEYLLIQPLTPAGKPNMIAWLAARNDAPNYGKLIVYELPKQELVFGPLQVEGRIDQEPTISQQFTLWDQRGSQVIRGNLLVIPLNHSFLYVEPVYLLSEASALPELKRVIVASDTNIVMRATLNEALTALLEEEPTDTITADSPPISPPDTSPSAPDATMEELIQSANAHFEAAETAQRNGDWAVYGQELEALQQDLQRLLELTGNTP